MPRKEEKEEIRKQMDNKKIYIIIENLSGRVRNKNRG